MDKGNKEQSGVLSRFIVWFSAWSVRYIPDAMVFVLALTVIAFLMAWGLTDHGPFQLVDDWVKGFWVLLTFAMQMSVLMITGFAVADSRPIKRVIRALVDWPQTARSTALLFMVVSMITWWLHWGIGMMLSMVMGREILVRKQHLQFHAAYIAALSYSGILMANGPSQAAPLLVATPGHFLEALTGVIPLSLTTFDPHLLITNLLLLITLPFVLLKAMPRRENSVPLDASIIASVAALDQDSAAKREVSTPAERWDRSPILAVIVAVAGLGWVANFILTKGIAKLDLNTLNFAFFMLGLLLHASPSSFVASVQRGTATIYGVVIQFPLYAGIFGMISYSGLSETIGHWFVSISTAYTFPWITYVYSGILDMFVPSAGSKFVIEAPYIVPAAQELGSYLPRVINAYTYGSINFNLIQPFWALPILGTYKLRFQDILPYSFITCMWGFIVISFGLLVLPLILG